MSEKKKVKMTSPPSGTSQGFGMRRETRLCWVFDGPDPDYWIGQIRAFPSNTSEGEMNFEDGHVFATLGKVEGNQRELTIPVTAQADRLMVGVAGYKDSGDEPPQIVALGGVSVRIT